MTNNYRTLTLEIDEHVAQVTLAQPEILNRLDDRVHEELMDVLNHLRRVPEIRAVVLASTGRAFSAGGDLNEVARLHADRTAREHTRELGRRIVHEFIDFPIPIIVALHGDAMGLGATLILLCDAIVASRNARIADPHVKVGLVAGDGGCVVWPMAVGFLRAKRHLLTGEPLGAEQAYAAGLVTDLADTPDEALMGARKLALAIAALPPIAVRRTKQALNHLLRREATQVFELSLAYEMESLASEDVLEALTAFKERRSGLYRNR
jgi:enoyl-CoA hydratase